MSQTQGHPGWQTEELEEEWVDYEDPSIDDEYTKDSSSISLTIPLPSILHENDDSKSNSPCTSNSRVVGTFLVHNNAPNLPFMRKTPGKNKGYIKDMFTPLPLERMFDPPSPRTPLSNKSVNQATPPIVPAKGSSSPSPQLPSDSKFTFSIPRDKIHNLIVGYSPQAESTPVPHPNPHPTPNPAEPPLRLFQFQYDTYTREHLSAMVDSIAVGSGSGTGTATTPPLNELSKVSEGNSPLNESFSDLRSAKRLKLSPPSDYYGEGDGAGAVISRPRLMGRDYVGASRALMEQIKKNRDFSTISTTVPEPENRSVAESPPCKTQLALPATDSEDNTTYGNSTESRSTSKYRLQAATLMAQIKNDVNSRKRVFSGDTEVSSFHEDGEKRHSFQRSASSPSVLQNAIPKIVVDALDKSVANLSLHDLHNPMAFAPPEPIIVQTMRVSQVIAPDTLRPAHPSSSTNVNDDLNRFVSSSTASGTTLTAVSAGSYVKHAGPTQIRTIAPGDLPSLPDRMGDMVYDKVKNRWVKSQAQLAEYLPPEEPSEDPFEDIESLRDDNDDDTGSRSRRGAELSRVEEEESEIDEEEMELTSFETDDPNGARVVDVEEDDITDSSEEGDYDDGEGIPAAAALAFGVEVDVEEALTSPEPDTSALPVPSSAGEAIKTTPLKTNGTPIKSALKNPTPGGSGLKMESGAREYRTPLRKVQMQHRRSVSFSDGKKDGPIRGLGRRGYGGDSEEVEEPSGESEHEGRASASCITVPSLRSKRIGDMMQALEGDSDDVEVCASGSPRKDPSNSNSNIRTRRFSRSETYRAADASVNANATFLTACSFHLAHDRLVQVLTDIEPYTPYWDQLREVNLSNKGLESVVRMKEWVGGVEKVNLDDNQLGYLSGLPAGVRVLSVCGNSLTSLTAWNHLLNLESLDVSRNELDGLTALSCLRRLRELRADGNKITSLESIKELRGLTKLSLQDNLIGGEVDFGGWPRLEMVDLSRNRIEKIRRLEGMEALAALNLDWNELKRFEMEETMTRLKILRLSYNKLGRLSVGKAPNVRTLYVDGNLLERVEGIGRRLENFSAREQRIREIELGDVKRIYLSGNAITRMMKTPSYNLVYLELASCRLKEVPRGMGSMVPNVRVLNMNYNFLSELGGLEGMARMRRMSVVGNKLREVKGAMKVLRGMKELEMVDLRLNPCTLGWYAPVIGPDWEERDTEFRGRMPDVEYVGRLAYRGVVMRICPKVEIVDGIVVGRKERIKAERLLIKIANRA